jgi:hypothetical protein
MNKESVVKINDLSAERIAHLNEMRAIGEDEHGQKVLVGLTLEETSFYLSFVEQSLIGDTDPEDGDRYLELDNKHEKARFDVLGAEHVLRTEKPSKH